MVSQHETIKATKAGRIAALDGATQHFRVERQTDDAMIATYVYDDYRRLTIHRWITFDDPDPGDGNGSTYAEIAVTGRMRDRLGLADLVDRAPTAATPLRPATRSAEARAQRPCSDDAVQDAVGGGPVVAADLDPQQPVRGHPEDPLHGDAGAAGEGHRGRVGPARGADHGVESRVALGVVGDPARDVVAEEQPDEHPGRARPRPRSSPARTPPGGRRTRRVSPGAPRRRSPWPPSSVCGTVTDSCPESSVSDLAGPALMQAYPAAAPSASASTPSSTPTGAARAA